MSISPVTSQFNFPVQFNTQQTTNAVSTAGATSNDGGASLSSIAQFFNQLKQLSTQDPSQFQQITAQIAQQLTAAAQSSTDPTQQAALTQLAGNFTQASQTGDFSSLLPPPSAGSSAAAPTQPAGFEPPSTGGHHHHHGGGYEAQASSDSAASTQSTLESIFTSAEPAIQSALNSSTTTPTTG